MWVLESFSREVVAGPFKSEAALAKKLGLSQQYVNRQLKKNELLFYFEGKKVLARRAKAFIAGDKTFTTKSDMAIVLGVSPEVIDKVFKKKSSGVIQTPKGKVRIAKIKPGETPIPLQPKVSSAVRVLWNDGKEKQEFSSFAAAAKELKIDPKTIPNAIKAGKDSFTRKSDGQKFTIEIPEEKTPPKVAKQKRLEEKVQAVEKVDETTARKKDAAEDEKEESFDDEKAGEETKSEKLTYLGMGLWEETKEEEEEDPFCDWTYEEHCPGLGSSFDLMFKKNKKNLLKPGEKVEKFIDTEKDYRVLIVDANFKEILDEYDDSKGFEDDFYLSALYPTYSGIQEYLKKYADLGMLPIFTGKKVKKHMAYLAYMWRIKITPPEKKTIDQTS